jgi:hypothetical protein
MSVMSDSDEDRIMATAHSVTLWLQQLKQGDRQAVGPLWKATSSAASGRRS